MFGEFGQQAVVGREPVDGMQFVGGEPARRFMFIQVRRLLLQHAQEAMHREMELRIIPFDRVQQVPYVNGAGELFGDFPAQGVLPAFAGLHLSAGEFPPVLPGAVAPLGCENAALPEDQGRDDFDPFQGITVR